jgi:hypothetical protein
MHHAVPVAEPEAARRIVLDHVAAFVNEAVMVRAEKSEDGEARLAPVRCT